MSSSPAFSIHRSKLDSDRFGIAVARAWYPQTEADVAAALEFCKREKVQLCIVRVQGEEPGVLIALKSKGFFVTDHLAILTLDIQQAKLENVGRAAIRQAVSQDTGTVDHIARAAFGQYVSHYHANPRLDRRAVDEVFPDWVQRAVMNQSDDSAVLIAEIDEIPAGFIALVRNPPAAVVDLVAVHPTYQRQHCMGSLLKASTEWARSKHLNEVTIAVQQSNTAVQKACGRFGFKPFDTRTTLHGWIDS
jgi:GNAT superfamily N-acetyltransferase